jgi:hypothetical protein
MYLLDIFYFLFYTYLDRLVFIFKYLLSICKYNFPLIELNHQFGFFYFYKLVYLVIYNK